MTPEPTVPLSHSDPLPSTVPAAAVVVTIPQIAELLQVDQRTIERWASARLIPGRLQLPGRSVRYLRTEVLDWIRNGCPRPEASRRRAR